MYRTSASLPAHLEFVAIQSQQLCPIDTSGSELGSVLVHAHGDQPQAHLLGVPFRNGSALPQVVVVGGNWVVVQRLRQDTGDSMGDADRT